MQFTNYDERLIALGTVLTLDKNDGPETIELDNEGYLEDTRVDRGDDPDTHIVPNIYDPRIGPIFRKTGSCRVKVTFMYSETVPGRPYAIEADLLEG